MNSLPNHSEISGFEKLMLEFYVNSCEMLMMELCDFCLLYTAGSLPPVIHVAVDSKVTVPCPILSATEMEFKLFKDSDLVTSTYIKINYTSIIQNDNSPNFPANLSVNQLNNSTSFILFGVTTNFTGLYTCEAEIMYPPPFKKVPHTPQAIVFVEGMFTMVVTVQQTGKSSII